MVMKFTIKKTVFPVRMKLYSKEADNYFGFFCPFDKSLQATGQSHSKDWPLQDPGDQKVGDKIC